MPRLELELSANLPELTDLPHILKTLTLKFADCPTIEPQAVKTYANVHQNYTTGPGARPGFVHLTVCLLSGRDQETRQNISQTLAQELQSLFARSYNDAQAGITVEIREMPRETFTKLT